MSKLVDDRGASVSAEFTRQVVKRMDKRELDLRTLGLRYAVQHHRELGRLHTFHPGERAELDYTKYMVWLYPNARWNEPLLFHTGIGLDHASGVIKGFVTTTQPSAATAIRLYKRCVLPKDLWLPERLQKHASEWDVMGLDRLVAIDNAADFRANSLSYMFLTLGIIVLCMPPRRGDMKGTVERALSTIENRNIGMLPGYVPARFKFTDPRQKRLLERAKAKAGLTVEEFEQTLLLAIMQYNEDRHPDFKRKRIDVYRKGLDLAPPVLLTGMDQIKTVFALTHRNRKVTREGVQVDTFKYNSPELNELYRFSDSRVDVKLDPDDIRSVRVYHRELREPIEARLTTHTFDEPITLELAKEVIGRHDGEEDELDGDAVSYEDQFLERVHEIQTRGRRGGPRRANADAQAAVHAAALQPVAPPKPTDYGAPDFDALFNDDN